LIDPFSAAIWVPIELIWVTVSVCRQLRGERVEAVRERRGRLGERLARREVVRRVRKVLPRGPVVAEQRREARVGRLVQRELDLVQAVLERLGRALEHRLGAQLDVDVVGADTLVLRHVDARAEQAGGDVRERRRRLEHRDLARVAGRGRVRDVVAGDVDRALLREDAAQRGLDAEEGRESHQTLASTTLEPCGERVQPPGE
jgi:hypothetical protein